MKKKIFGITLAVCILVLSIASTTIAYFTDTDEQTQVFTAGNVDIKLSDNILAVDGVNPSSVYPGQKIGDAAVITNIGSEQAYVGAVISLGTGTPEIDEDVAEALFTNLATFVEYKGNKFYIVFSNPVDKNSSVTIFDSITVPTTWDNNAANNTNMSIFANLNITVTAYATQTAGMTDAADALAKAFPSVWGPSN